MLLLLKLFFEKNYPDKKQIDTAGNCGVLFYCFPRGFHFTAPVNIIKNENRIIIGFNKQFFKISFSWFLPVVAVDERKVDRRQTTDHGR